MTINEAAHQVSNLDIPNWIWWTVGIIAVLMFIAWLND
jgi:hypothetical protein